MLSAPRFEIFKDKQNQWRFRLRAENGEIICQSEGYKTRQGALKGIASIRSCALKAELVNVSQKEA